MENELETKVCSKSGFYSNRWMDNAMGESEAQLVMSLMMNNKDDEAIEIIHQANARARLALSKK